MDTPAITKSKKGLFAKAAASAVAREDDVPAMRPALREDDPRARAAQRAAELRGHLGELDEGVDEFFVDPSDIPEGWTYEWKRYSVYEEEDTANQLSVQRAGWTPVPASRHPRMMPHNTTMSHILRKGLLLMECPTEIVEERRRIEQNDARKQVKFKEAQLAGTPEGTMTRDHRDARPKIKKSFEAMPVPEE